MQGVAARSLSCSSQHLAYGWRDNVPNVFILGGSGFPWNNVDTVPCVARSSYRKNIGRISTCLHKNILCIAYLSSTRVHFCFEFRQAQVTVSDQFAV